MPQLRTPAGGQRLSKVDILMTVVGKTAVPTPKLACDFLLLDVKERNNDDWGGTVIVACFQE